MNNDTQFDIIKKRLAEEIVNCGIPIAEIANKIGVSASMVTQYKTTDKLPSLETFAVLCKELDLSAEYILGIKDN